MESLEPFGVKVENIDTEEEYILPFSDEIYYETQQNQNQFFVKIEKIETKQDIQPLDHQICGQRIQLNEDQEYDQTQGQEMASTSGLNESYQKTIKVNKINKKTNIEVKQKRHRISYKNPKNVALIESAIKEYNKSKRTISVRSLANKYGIARGSLWSRIQFQDALKYGSNQRLNNEEVKALEIYIQMMSDWDRELSNKDIKKIVDEYVKTNKPGRRHTTTLMSNRLCQLSVAKSSLCKVRAMTRDKLNDFYAFLAQTFQSNPTDIDLGQIFWNCDCSAFYSDSNVKTVFATRGVRNVNQNSNCVKNNYTTVLVCGSAFGCYMKPFIVFKGEKINEEWKTWNGAKYGITDTGSVNSKTFLQWFKEVFIPESARFAPKGYSGPRFLVLDAHTDNINVISVAQKHSIILIRLPSHSTHILQPLDVSFFSQIKNLWQNLLEEKNRQNIFTPSKSEFPLLFREIWNQIKPEYIVNGFGKTGIFPLNKDVISDEELFTAQTLPWDKDGIQCFGESEAETKQTLAHIKDDYPKFDRNFIDKIKS